MIGKKLLLVGAPLTLVLGTLFYGCGGGDQEVKVENCKCVCHECKCEPGKPCECQGCSCEKPKPPEGEGGGSDHDSGGGGCGGGSCDRP